MTKLAGTSSTQQKAENQALERAVAKIQLGQRLRARREELPEQHHATVVARVIGWTPQFLGEIERGTKSSDDARAWLRLADILQLNPRDLLEQVWETREGFTLSLPPQGDERREALLDLAIQIYGADLEALP